MLQSQLQWHQTMAKPIIKWVGGKTQLLPELVKRLPADFDQRRYIEPFIGGGALFFHLERDDAWINDHNIHLVRLYATVQRNPNPVLRLLQKHADRYNRTKDTAAYLEVREAWNARPARTLGSVDDPAAAAMFIFLNKTCFNGVYRVNKAGSFNVPPGDYKRPHKIADTEAIVAASRVLQPATITCGDFMTIKPYADNPAFLYVDPPYAPVSATANFTSYTENGFGSSDQFRLAVWLRALNKLGHKWMLSNSDVPEIRKLYDGFRIERVDARRSINSKGSARGEVGELIVRNY